MTTIETTTEVKESTSDVVSKEPKKKSKLYFNADTQAAIILFQNTVCPIKRNTIYINDIQNKNCPLSIFNSLSLPPYNQTNKK